MLENKSAYAVGTLRYTAAGLGIVMFWLLFGEFAIAFRDRAAMPSVTELLRQHHASDTMIAVLVSALPALLGSALVPIVGFRSDRFRSRWGRRLPFLVGMTPVAALILVALGNCTPFGRATDRLLGALSPGVDTCVLAWFCVFWTLFEAVALVTLALYGGLVDDIVPRRIGASTPDSASSTWWPASCSTCGCSDSPNITSARCSLASACSSASPAC